MASHQTDDNTKDYFIDSKHSNQYVLPYWHTHQTFVKQRWRGKSLISVLLTEWSYLDSIVGIKNIEKYCKNKQILINDEQCSIHQILKHDDCIKIVCHKHEPPISYHPQHTNSLMTIHESRHILVVLKPSTLPTHPSSLYHKNSLIYMIKNGHFTKYKPSQQNTLLYSDNIWFENHLKKQSLILEQNNNFCSISEEIVSSQNNHEENKENQDANVDYWITHRLDRLTSGLLIIAKHRLIAKYLMKMFRERCIKKRYLCLVHGKFDDVKYKNVKAKLAKSTEQSEHNLMVIDFERGKEAETVFTTIWYDEEKDVSLVVCQPLTGRQHQIRAHLALFCKSPIVNDPLYNFKGGDGKYDELRFDEEILYKVNSKKVTAEDVKGFGCHVCDNDDKSIGVWWNDLISNTTSLNKGIYLHAFSYKAVDESFCFQTPLPVWACPPSDKTQMFATIF